MLQRTRSGNMISSQRRPRGRTALAKKHWMEDDEAEAAADGDDNASDDEGSTGSEGVGDKRTRGRDRKTRHLKSLVYTSNSFVAIRDKQQNVVQAKCCIMTECTGKACGTTMDILQNSPKSCWNHLQTCE